MRRILFVDDETAILRAMERTLRPLRHEWECRFADNPLEALDVVDSFQPDAVVSDMLMPDLDGAEFLSEAARRQPVMARVILSGEVDAGSLVRMAASAHQCLAKPCRGDVLIGVVRSALPEEGSERRVALQHELYKLNGLPVSAASYEAVRRALGRAASNARDDDVIRVIGASPGITAKLLQVATWTRMGAGAPPLRVRDAFHQLGADAVSSLLDSEMFRPRASADVTLFQPQAWRHCERASAAAATIAGAEGLPEDTVDDITLVTLMGATAPLLLDALSEADYEVVRLDARRLCVPRHTLEQEWFGLTGAQFTARLLRLWGLSSDLATWVAKGDDPAMLAADALTPDTVSYFARALTDPVPSDSARAAMIAQAEQLGLSERLRAWERLVAPAVH